MNQLNHTFIYKFKTGTIIQVGVIRDGVNYPKYIFSEIIENLNFFEQLEYIELRDYMTITLYNLFTSLELESILTQSENLIKKIGTEYSSNRA